MKHKTFQTRINIYDRPEALPGPEQRLLKAAWKALELAYAPYSHFNVGAAALLESGAIASGANQENAAYPMCLCAERVALGNAALNHPEETILLLAIVIRNTRKVVKQPAGPCGSCRQAISEMEERQHRPIRLLLQGDGEEVYEIPSGRDLLPLGFNSRFL